MKLVFECQLTKLENQLLIELVDSLEITFVLNKVDDKDNWQIDLINKKLFDINTGVKIFKLENTFYLLVCELNVFMDYLKLLIKQNDKQGSISKLSQTQCNLISNYEDFIRLSNNSLSI